MTPVSIDADTLATLARVTLYVHFLVVVFNAAGLVAICLGGWLHWAWVRIFWWRALHVVLLFLVAAQAALGRDCFLTIWQAALEDAAGAAFEGMHWLDRLIFYAIYWPLPASVFVLLYVAVLVIVILLWWLVPVRRGT